MAYEDMVIMTAVRALNADRSHQDHPARTSRVESTINPTDEREVARFDLS